MNTTIPTVRYFVTEIGTSLSGQPIAVGWDFCSCGYHVSICKCAGGPTEPKYVTALRTREAEARAEREQERAARTSPTATAVGTMSLPRKASEPVTEGVRSDTLTRKPNNSGQSCTVCHQSADDTNADQNDDGTWTHHDCQGG